MTQRHKTQFPDLGEFQFVKKLLERQIQTQSGADNAELRLGVGDDCALLDRWLISTDMSVENVHFRLDWSTPEEAVEKAVLSNLSDLNAMGSEVRYALLSLCLSRQWDASLRSRIAMAFAESLERHGVEIIGGDTVSGAVGCFSLTVLGECPEGLSPLFRSAAQPGDFLYVSGPLGGSAGGLRVLLDGLDQKEWASLVKQHRVPQVPLGLGRKALLSGFARAAIDVSDGLSSELHHLAEQSGVLLEIEEASIPIHPEVLRLCQTQGLSSRPFWLNGGEDYQLIFSSPKEPSLLVLALCPYEVHCIGRVYRGHGVNMLRRDGSREVVEPKAWSHL